MKSTPETNSVSYYRTALLAATTVVTLLLLAGCVVQSLTPFYEESSVLKMPRLEGEWRLIKDGGRDMSKERIRAWTIKGDRVRTFEGRGVGSTLEIAFFKVGTTTFVDVTAGAPDEAGANRWWVFHVAPVHTVCKVLVGEDRLVLIPLNPYWMKKNRKGNGPALPHIKPMQHEDVDVYYPSPAVWMKFLKVHQHDDEAFSNSGRYELLRIHTPVNDASVKGFPGIRLFSQAQPLCPGGRFQFIAETKQ